MRKCFIHSFRNIRTNKVFCLVFCLPFSIINCLKLRRRQKIGLVGVFSLGAITMAISLARFIVYSVDYNVSDAIGSKSASFHFPMFSPTHLSPRIVLI